MAEKVLQTRIINKNADLATWSDSTLALKTGEIALARVETLKVNENGESVKVPTYLMKVGDGDKTFKELEWLAAPASDVYAWAKAATKPDYAATEITRGESTVDADLTTIEGAIQDLQDAIGEGGSVADAIQTAIEALDVDASTDADGVIISSISEADGKISVTRRALTDADIASLNVAMEKVTGLVDALALKADKADIGTSADVAGTATVYGAIATAKEAGDNAQSALNTYIGTNDKALADVKATAEAATTVDEATQIAATAVSNFNTNTIVPLTQRVTDAETAISTLNAATTFAGTGTYAEMTALENVKAGSIFVVIDTTESGKQYNNKEFVYDGAKWVELGDTTAELAAITELDGRLNDVETSLAEGGDTAEAIAAAQADATQALADADTANKAIEVINGTGNGSLAKVLADANDYTDKELADFKTETVDPISTELTNHKNATGNVHGLTKADIELGNVENKSVAEIKTELTGAVAEGNDGFVTGGAVASAIAPVAQATSDNASNITTIQNNYARVEGDALVYGQGDNLMTIIFDCGGAE